MVWQLIEFTTINENDGSLTAFESQKDIPFEIRRCFYISGVSVGKQRADHASITTDFVLIAINGSVEVELDDGRKKTIYTLESRSQGLLVPKYTWMKTRKFSSDAVLLVLASNGYRESKYIDSYEDFKKQKNI